MLRLERVVIFSQHVGDLVRRPPIGHQRDAERADSVVVRIRRKIAQRIVLEPSADDAVWPVLQNYPYGTTWR